MTRCCGIWCLFEAAGVFDYSHSSRSSLHHPQVQRQRRWDRSVWLAVNDAISILAFLEKSRCSRASGRLTGSLLHWYSLNMVSYWMLHSDRNNIKEPQVSLQQPGQKMPGTVRLTLRWWSESLHATSLKAWSSDSSDRMDTEWKCNVAAGC